MTQNKKITLIILIILALLLAAGAVWFFYFKKAPAEEPNEGEKINPAEFIVFEIKLENLSDYQRDQSFERFTQAKNIINQNGQDYALDANFYAWLEIASVQKLIADYQRAEQIWLWFTDAYPHNSISPANLGDLYKSFLVDKEKSEKYYQIALEREKNDFQIYYGFYELYRYVFEDPDKAIAVLQQGMQDDADNLNYINELISYLLEIDRREQAEKIVDDYVAQHPEQYGLRARLKESK